MQITLGWFFIVLAIISATIIAHLLRKAKSLVESIIPVLVVNYLIATIIGIAQLDYNLTPILYDHISLYLFSFVIGVGFIANFFVYSKSLTKNGLGLSVSAMRVSLVIPLFSGFILFNESISIFNFLGILLLFIAIYFLFRSHSNHYLAAPIALIILFFISGFNDLSLKIFDYSFKQISDSYFFMTLVFFSAGIVGFIILLYKRIRFSRQAIILGILIGIPNFYSSIFTLSALEVIISPIVFSAINAGTILSSAFIGKYIWKDKLSRNQFLALSISLIAIVLLII